MNNDSNTKAQLRKKCCEEHVGIIKGRRLSDLESKIFHGWTDIFDGIDQEILTLIIKKWIKRYPKEKYL